MKRNTTLWNILRATINLGLIKVRAILILLLMVALAVVALSSCNNDSENVTITKEEYQKMKGDIIRPEYPKSILVPYSYEHMKPYATEIQVIDSCEYIIGQDNGSYNGGLYLTHKGNCKFCRAWMKEEIRKAMLERDSIK